MTWQATLIANPNLKATSDRPADRWFDARDEIRQKFSRLVGRDVAESEFGEIEWVEREPNELDRQPRIVSRSFVAGVDMPGLYIELNFGDEPADNVNPRRFKTACGALQAMERKHDAG
jgi:hypothetical protein